MNGLGDSDDVYLEGEASRFRWLRTLAMTEIDLFAVRESSLL